MRLADIFTRSRTTLRSVVACAAAAILIAGAIQPAAAQERPRTLFEMLFSPRRAPPPPEPETRRTEPRVKKPVRQRAARPAPPAVPVVEKAADARTVLVVGDFLGVGLAEGLTEAFAENSSVVVVNRSNGSSGIVRSDFYDWPAELPAIIDAQKPAALVIMLGSNDRQEMQLDGKRAAVRTPEWTKAYEQRVAALARIAHDRKVPLIWVGMPPFRQGNMSSDMVALNDIFRTGAEAVGGAYVDIWDGFVDENGVYATSGPDIKGNPVRLRSGDNGVNFTRAAKRKVAFYVEKPLEKILGPLHQQVIGSDSPVDPLQPLSDPGEPVELDRTAPMSLSDPALNGGDELLGARFATPDKTRTPAEKMSVEGVMPPAISGRADDFGNAVPAKAALPATPLAAQPSNEQTTAIPPRPKG